MRYAVILALLMAPVWGGYTYIRPITINHTKVGASTHADFPVLVAGTYPWLATVSHGGKVQNPNGFDVAFFADNTLGSPLKHEVEKYDAATGEVIYWVKVPWLLHTADTVIYIAYGNSSISASQADPTQVWDAGFRGVWHLAQDPAGTGPQLLDSTSYGNHLTSVGSMTSNNLVAGKVGAAIDLDGVNDRLERLDNASLSITGSLTTSIWFRMVNNPPAAREGLLCKWANYSGYSNMRSYCLGIDQSTGRVSGLVSANGQYADGSSSTLVTGSADRANGAWRHAVMVFNPGAGMVLYVDGQLEATRTTGVMPAIYDSTAKFWLGSQNTEETYYNAEATIDEARVSGVARSADWILAEYNNQNDPASFYSVGVEQAPTPSRKRSVVAMSRWSMR
jgi:hypothetical protein